MVREETDVALMERCRRNEADAFAHLVERHRNRAFRIAFHTLQDADEALDVVQEAFVRVFRSRDRYDPSRPFANWFSEIATNLSIDHLRRRPRRKVAPLDGVEPEGSRETPPLETLESRETRRAVWEALKELPENYRIVLVLRELEGLETDEVARILRISNPTVRWRLHKARKAFRRVWEKKMAGSPPL